MESLHIQPLDTKVHDREGFDCGVSELNEYLSKRARKEMAAGVAACFVGTMEDEPGKIVGYFTLSAATIKRRSLPDDLVQKLPRYRDFPATLLGRLAVSVGMQGRRIGSYMLFSALRHSLDAVAEVASYAVVTDPKDRDAEQFYRRFGFRSLEESRLFLTMKDIQKQLSVR